MEDNTFEIKDFTFLEGFSFDDAKLKIEGNYFLNPNSYNDRSCVKTDDLNMYRINVIVENDIIVKVNGQG